MPCVRTDLTTIDPQCQWVHAYVDVAGGWSVADVWKMREECIAALAQCVSIAQHKGSCTRTS